MNVFSLCFVVISTILIEANGYAFRGSSSSTVFAFGNTEMSLEELEQSGNRLYLGNSEKLSIVCQLVDKSNWSLSRSEELTKKYALTGLQPYITFKNKTWWKTYHFPPQTAVSSVRWRLEITRNEFVQGPNDVLFEPWFVRVELGHGLGLFVTKGILIPTEKLFNLSQNLGSIVDSSLMLKSSEKFVVKPAPCCSDISFILPFKNKTAASVGGCYMGISFGSFNPQTFLWLNLCSRQNNQSLCNVFPRMDCDKLRMLDHVVTRNYLILATSFGVVRSASFRKLISEKSLGDKNFMVISSSSTLLDTVFMNGDVHNDLELQYTPYCLDFHIFDEKKDIFYLLYRKSEKLVYKSQSPFNKLREISISFMSLNGLQILGIVNDLTKNTHVLLCFILREKVDRYLVLVISQEASGLILFPPWYFSKDSIVTHLRYHTWSNTLFAYGSQVWQSRDGGNSFHQLTELNLDHITSLSFPQYGDSVVALTDDGTILKGRIGILRIIAIHHQPFVGPLHLIFVDELENIQGFFRDKSGSFNLFGDYFVDTIHLKSFQKHFCDHDLLLQFVSSEEILLFVSAPYDVTNQTLSRSYCFGSYAVGQVFKSRLGGSAHITEITPLNSSSRFLTRARCNVLEPFTTVQSSSRQVLESNIRVRLVESQHYQIMFEISISGKGAAWSITDEGKTVVLSNGMSILLMRYLNESVMYGLAPGGISPSLSPESAHDRGTWQLYDLRSANIIVQRKNDLLSLRRSADGFEASALFDFKSNHVGMILMISSDNFGIIRSVKADGSVTFMNISMLREGNFSVWSIYEPPLNITQLTSSDFTPDTGYEMWWIEEEDCADHPIVTPKEYKTLYHLDSRDNISLEFSVLTKHLENDDPKITMFVGNPSLFAIRSDHLHSETNHTLKIDLQRKPGTSGLAQMSFDVRYKSLECPSASIVLTMHGGCPPSKRLVFQYPSNFTPDTFLHGSPFDDKGILRSYKLPANYRPPSSRGIGIPMSSNLYNVFPEKPPYKEKFTISRQTRLYKQCLGKSFRKDCRCDVNYLNMSTLVLHSDCINTVYRLLFQEIFKPRFVIVEDDALTKPFHDPYYLVELNQRADYDVLKATTMYVSDGSSRTVLQENLNGSLEFRGSGLYHFRAYGVQEGFTICELSDEFIVFVDEAPLPHPARDIVRVTTAMVFVSAIFFAYLWYFYLSRKGDLNRVFGDA